MTSFAAVERLNREYSEVGVHRFFDNRQLTWVKTVEELHADIRDEYFQLGKLQSSLPTLQELSGNRGAIRAESWRALFLYSAGERLINEVNCFRRTYEALDRIPMVKTAFFSVMPPGCVIPPHRGPFNGVLRLHLGISIPKGDCAISVGGETRSWRNGAALVFDDSYEHTAWNRTDETRIVLFVDFLRPFPEWYQPFNEENYERLCESEFRVAFHKNAAKSASDIVTARGSQSRDD